MDLRSGSKDLTVPSIMLERFLHGTLLSSGKPPGRPPDLEWMRGILSFSSPLLDSEEVETLEECRTTWRVWDKPKEEGDTLLTL